MCSLILGVTLMACSGPSQNDLAELIALDQENFADVTVQRVERENARWIRAIGTARVKAQTLEPLSTQEVAALCEAGVAQTRNWIGRQDPRVYFVKPGADRGLPIRFNIGMAPDKAEPADPPDEISSGGWTNGAWDLDYDVDGWGGPIFRSRSWYGSSKVVAVVSDDVDALCDEIRGP